MDGTPGRNTEHPGYSPAGTPRPRPVLSRAPWRAGKYLAATTAWNRAYGFASYARSALWIIPFVAIVLVLVAAPVVRWLDGWLGWRFVGLRPAGAQALYETVVTLTLSFTVFTFGSLLVAIQVASGQLTPRIIATTLLRDNVVRYSVGLFVFTLIFAVSALNRQDDAVPELVAFIVSMLGVACMATFLFLIDYAARLLRPVSIVARVGGEGLGVIDVVYPEPAGVASERPDASSTAAQRRPARVVQHWGNSQIVLAVDLRSLMAHAERCDGVIELLPQVGDFVAYEEPLFALYDGAAGLDDRVLHVAVAFGAERTLEQDPMFAFRILVDIALKALSPAINDPTTAVLAIDQVHRLLKAVGRRTLQCDELFDGAGRLRVICRTPNWEDFVDVACTEIRAAGAGQVQVARRLHAMLDNVAATVPAYRRAALAIARERLDRDIDEKYPYPEDRALARIPDTQGLGGSRPAATTPEA